MRLLGILTILLFSGLVPLSAHYAMAVAERQCADCKGTGAVDCKTCNTVGKVNCRKCGGKGVYKSPYDNTSNPPATCDDCKGEGRIICPDCNGRGKRRCSTCDGKGTRI